jgi:REP element-mobilizing transposase RayT
VSQSANTNRTVFWAEYHVTRCAKYRHRVLVGAVEDWFLSTIGGGSLEMVRCCVENQKRVG